MFCLLHSPVLCAQMNWRAQFGEAGTSSCSCSSTISSASPLQSSHNTMKLVYAIACLTHCLQICRQCTVQVKFTPTVTLTETMHSCYMCGLLKSHYCEMYHTQNNDTQFNILSTVHQTHSLCTRSFLYNCLEHFIMPKSRGCNTLVKFGGQHTIFTSFEMTYLVSE
jgi:hypothetical protein